MHHFGGDATRDSIRRCERGRLSGFVSLVTRGLVALLATRPTFRYLRTIGIGPAVGVRTPLNTGAAAEANGVVSDPEIRLCQLCILPDYGSVL
jgi:hypothetical protein